MEYYFDHEWQHERERLRQLERVFDPLTHASIESVGIMPGWRCLEAGGGGGSIAEWLAWRVGPTGHVLATDLEIRFLEPLARPNLEVREHRLGADPLPESSFDLVHARAVMEHQPDRMPALRQVFSVLRPDGWVVFESADFGSLVASRPEHAELFSRGWSALERLLLARGFRSDCGRRLSCELEQVGFEQVTYAGHTSEWGGRQDSLTKFYTQTFDRLAMGITDFGAAGISRAELEDFLALCKRPDFRATSHITCVVRGRKPR